MSELNLLDLPVENLEELFSFCNGSLLKLTETNSYIKNVIGSSSRLMENIKLNVELNRGNMSAKDQEILEACLNSTRRYRTIKLELIANYSGEKMDMSESNSADDILEIKLRQLFDENAESLREVEINLGIVREKNILNTLSLLDNLLNVEKISVTSYDDEGASGNTSDDDVPSNSYQVSSNNFKKLKVLKIYAAHSSVLHFFQECQKIITFSLEVHNREMELTSIYSMKNSRETLKSLDVYFYENYALEVDAESKFNNKIAGFLSALMNLQLNLKDLTLDFPKKLNRENVVRLKNFVLSQSNLENFYLICISADLILLNNIKEILEGNLKVLRLNFYANEDGNADESMYQPWNLNNLESLNIEDVDNSEHNDMNYARIIFHSPSDTLKEVELIQLELSVNAIPSITRNYKNLTTLSVNYCINHQSDDIFLILKHLKKLKTLEFSFPDDNDLDANLFDNNEDYILPDIQRVHFDFNDFIENFHVMRLLQYLKNTLAFSFNAWCKWKNCNNDTLYIVTRELPNLKDFKETIRNLEHSTLERIKSNVELFNKNPHFFRLNGKKIDVLLKELNCQ